MKLSPWSSISTAYTECAILGNGASIAISNSLSYSSLFDAATDLGHLKNSQQSIFTFFDTNDFEFVLRALSHAHVINHHLGVSETSTATAYQQIRQGLIRTVKYVHPKHSDVAKHFSAISTFLSRFQTVFSLNYDLLIYWAMMAANDKAVGNLFKDCFHSSGRFQTDYDYLRKPHGPLSSSTLVFYPHGNLALATDMWGDETKIFQSSGSPLIDQITTSWTLGGNNPLFVSEGDHEKKLRSIGRNAYLNQVYSELASAKQSVLVYGWSFGEQDAHILAALGRAKVARFAISVHSKSKDPAHFCYEVTRRIQQTRGLEKARIDFFDSAESGIWVNP